jgi:hypothetical protein
VFEFWGNESFLLKDRPIRIIFEFSLAIPGTNVATEIANSIENVLWASQNIHFLNHQSTDSDNSSFPLTFTLQLHILLSLCSKKLKEAYEITLLYLSPISPGRRNRVPEDTAVARQRLGKPSHGYEYARIEQFDVVLSIWSVSYQILAV